MIITTILLIAFLTMVFLPTTISGRYLLEKIIPMTKEQKVVYLAAKKALETQQYTLKDLSWVYCEKSDTYASYDIIFNLPMGQLNLKSLNCETLKIKTSEGFENCNSLNSAHLVMMTRSFATKLLEDKDLATEKQKQERILMAKRQIV